MRFFRTGLSVLLLQLCFACAAQAQETPVDVSSEKSCYECTAWSSCSFESVQTRSCVRKEGCLSLHDPLPIQTRYCSAACFEDAWRCSDFGACRNGRRTRTCSLQYDCVTASTPRPIEMEYCKEQCFEDTWSCGPWSDCTNDGVQKRVCRLIQDCEFADTPKPEELQACTPQCKPYHCTDWTRCQYDGHQRRTCQINTACTAKSRFPEEKRVCLGLRCGYLETAALRSACRLHLTNGQILEEFLALHKPTHCDNESTLEARKECRTAYSTIDTCTSVDTKERMRCVQQALQVQSFAVEKNLCLLLPDQQKEACRQRLYGKVRTFALFTTYDLEWRAQMLRQKHLLTDVQVQVFIEVLELQRHTMATSTHMSIWQWMLRDVDTQWQELIASAQLQA